MKKYFLSLIVLAVVAVGVYLYAADHIDAPGVTDTASDITDFYSFQSPENSANLVFVANVQGLMSPSASSSANFAENSLIEFNIDNNGDNIEDLVIQCTFENGVMQVYGPYAPATTGTSSIIAGDAVPEASVAVTSYGSSAEIGTGNDLKIFAGPRDDPFFFDFTRFTEILGGTASSFNDPGSDTFAGTNVLSAVVEVPKSKLGSAGVLNTWVETKVKQ